MKKEISNKKDLLEVLKDIPYSDNNQRNKIVCSLIDHSLIQTTWFGYFYCGRCGEQLGDALASIYPIADRIVIVGHNCKTCKDNYKKCTWKDKIFVPNPFKKDKE